jgi:protein ImuB
LALVEHQRSTIRVAALSAAAERAGLRAGMTLAQARAIAPALRDLPHDAKEDRRALEALAVSLGRFSPIVGITGDRALALDVTGCAALFGGEEPLARGAAAEASARGYASRWAVASTPAAARAIATHGPNPTFLAAPDADIDALVGLPPVSLGIPQEAAARLAALGVTTIAALLRLPRAALAARVGPEVSLQLDRALGLVSDPIAAHRATSMPSEKLVFAGAVDRHEPIQLAIEQLARGLAAQLEGLRLGARALACVIERPEAPPERLLVSLSRARRSAAWFMSVLKARFERIDLGLGITSIELSVASAEELPHGEPEWFEGGAAKANVSEELRALLDRFAARLGERSFGWVSTRDDARPERAWALAPQPFAAKPLAQGEPAAARPLAAKPLAQGEPAAARPLAAKPLAQGEPAAARALAAKPLDRVARTPRRPIRLLAKPAPLEVEWDADGAPARLRGRGESWQRVAAAAGPEHIETGWWDGGEVARAYFEVRRENGEEWWVYRDLATGRGYVHGLFG